MSARCNELVDAYLRWLRERIKVEEIDGVCEITTPFLDRHNDCLQIYVERKNGSFRLTDDGYVLGDLEATGCGVDTPHRRQLLGTILNGFGVRAEDEELVTEANLGSFPQRKHALVQAMMAVNDMFMTAKPRVAQLFVEDVAHFLDDNNVRHTPFVEFTGRSGFVHKFDFVIPKSRSRPERVIRAINNPSRDTATSLLFAWTDSRDVRPAKSRIYAFLNDTEREIKPDLIGAFEQYDVQAVKWSTRQTIIDELAA